MPDNTSSGWYLYRAFDLRGQLLYIGIATVPKRRIASHGHAPWGRWAARFDVESEPCADNATDAEGHETEAIVREHPVFNVRQAGIGARARREAYERDHADDPRMARPVAAWQMGPVPPPKPQPRRGRPLPVATVTRTPRGHCVARSASGALLVTFVDSDEGWREAGRVMRGHVLPSRSSSPSC